MNTEKIKIALETGKTMMGDDKFAQILKPMMDEAIEEINKPRVRAKFQCNSITPGWNEGQKHVRFNAVYSTDGENADFARLTPSGSFDMVIDSATTAYDYFEKGKYYYLDITEAPAK